MNHPLDKKLPKLIRSETACEIKGRKIQIDYLELPNKKQYEYITFISHFEAVMVLAETKDGKFVINEEYRCPVDRILLSLPGGCVDEGEEPKDAAPRELLEETGYQGKEIIFLGSAYPTPGNHPQQTFYYLAREAEKIQEPEPEICELFLTKEMTLEEINQRHLDAENLDGHVSTALYLKHIRNL